MENATTQIPLLRSLSLTALFGFIFGAIAFTPLSVLPLPFVGLLLSIIGLKDTNLTNGKHGRYIAITGVVLNGIAILWFISYTTDNFGL